MVIFGLKSNRNVWNSFHVFQFNFFMKCGKIDRKIVCCLPGSTSFLAMCSRLLISSSCGAWITMVVDPRMLSRQPSLPCRFNRSVRKYDESTALQRHTLIVHTYNYTNMSNCKEGLTVSELSVPDQHTEGSQWSDESSRSKSISCEVGCLPSSHCKGQKHVNNRE